MRQVFGIPERYLLRWKFTYFSGHERFGCWNKEGSEINRAYNQTKSGLVQVSVQTKDIFDHTIRDLWTVPSYMYEDFQWMAAGSMNVLGFSGEESIPCEIFGCRLITSTKIYSITIAGSIKIEDRD